MTVWQKSDPEILEIFLAALQRMYPSLGSRRRSGVPGGPRAGDAGSLDPALYRALSASTAHLTSEPLSGQLGPDRQRHPERQRDRGAGQCKCRRAESLCWAQAPLDRWRACHESAQAVGQHFSGSRRSVDLPANPRAMPSGKRIPRTCLPSCHWPWTCSSG